MTHESPTTKYFCAAVSQIIDKEGHGAQVHLARRARVSASYLNDLLSGRSDVGRPSIFEMPGLHEVDLQKIILMV
jgi:hypothetical protein